MYAPLPKPIPIDESNLTRYELHIPSQLAKGVQNGTVQHYFLEDTDNYWKDAIEEVRNNKAYIVLLEEEQNIEIKKLYHNKNIGFQKLVYEKPTTFNGDFFIRGVQIETKEFALRNGMLEKDLLNQFKGIDKSELLLIHFTDFRY